MTLTVLAKHLLVSEYVCLSAPPNTPYTLAYVLNGFSRMLTSTWFGCHSKTIALTSAPFFKRSLMADVGICPLSSFSCSEGNTFRCVSWCSSFKISWSSSVYSSSLCPIMSSSMSSSFTSNSRSLAVVKISSIISGMYS
ncbi:uncharacterized protein TNCV_853501 [Trichonephila clavipes]|nr:uncharacterized protein TNCV_853501 [Trichonephila clavipes]